MNLGTQKKKFIEALSNTYSNSEIEQLFNSAGIVLFENFYESYEDLPIDEKIELYKRNNPIIVSYNRDKQLGKIL